MIATRVILAALLALGLGGIPSSVWARGARVVNGGTHTTVNRNANVNRNVNVNRDIDVDVDRDYHPIARTAAVATTAAVTAAVVGSVVYNLPPACTATVVGDVTYQQCGSTWYQPQYQGTQLTYVVVDPPG